MELQLWCVERLEALMKFPKKFVRLTSVFTEDDDSTYKKLMRIIDEVFWENCRSVSCKNGPNIDDEVKEGARVRSIEEGKSQVTSHVVGVGFVKKAKHEAEENDNFQTDAFCVAVVWSIFAGHRYIFC